MAHRELNRANPTATNCNPVTIFDTHSYRSPTDAHPHTRRSYSDFSRG